jgi:hypothetical protein
LTRSLGSHLKMGKSSSACWCRPTSAGEASSAWLRLRCPTTGASSALLRDSDHPTTHRWPGFAILKKKNVDGPTRRSQ